MLRKRGEADQVGEQHRDEAPLGDGRRRPHRLGPAPGACDERRSALTAEPIARVVRRAAARTGRLELSTAVRTDPPTGAILGAACGAIHRSAASSLLTGRTLRPG